MQNKHILLRVDKVLQFEFRTNANVYCTLFIYYEMENPHNLPIYSALKTV
jgi:hypothetical protein